MGFRKMFVRLPGKEHDARASCHAYLRLTGKPPDNHSEHLIKKVMEDRQSMPLTRLHEQVCWALYREELRLGSGTLDIGVWGPRLFAKDAELIISGLRSEFAALVIEDSIEIAGTEGETAAEGR